MGLDLEPHIRRTHLPPPPSVDEGEPRLVALLRAEIDQTGPLTFARFMQRALYEPGLGYYATSAERTTRAGDFLTAPELHPIFGHAIARQLHEMWQRLGEPARFTLREYGAGTGSLAVAILDGLARLGSPLRGRLRYQPVELPERLPVIEARLGGAGLGDVLDPRPAGERIVGCVLANEFLDALPVHRVERRDGELRELFVTWRHGRFAEVHGPLSTPALAGWFEGAAAELADGQRADAALAMLDWVAELDATLERGYALILDYGDTSSRLYGPSRAHGTLRAFRGQHVSSDVLHGVGRQDLTSHVDLDALRRAAEAAGLAFVGRTSQAEFLVGCGLEELLQEEQAHNSDDWEAYVTLRSAVRRLIDPQALGGYAAVILGRAVRTDAPLRGLAYRLPPRG